MSKWITLAACVAAVFASQDAFSVGLVANQAVMEVRVDKNGKGYVAFAADLGDSPPSCTQASYRRMLAFDANTAPGRAIMALALTTQARGGTVYARGTGDCGVYGVMEDWSWGRTN